MPNLAKIIAPLLLSLACGIVVVFAHASNAENQLGNTTKQSAATVNQFGNEVNQFAGFISVGNNNSVKKFMLSSGDMVFKNESETKVYNFYLAEDRVEDAELYIGLTTSIYSAPEQTVLKASINGQPIINNSPQFSASTDIFRATVPAVHLQQGWNQLIVDVRQHHRTDCTPESVSQLWAMVDPRKTYLSYKSVSLSDESFSNRIAGLDVGENRIFNANIHIEPALLDDLSGSEIIFELAKTIGWLRREDEVMISINNSAGLEHKDYDLQVELMVDSDAALPEASLNNRTRNHPPVLTLKVTRSQDVDLVLKDQVIQSPDNNEELILLDNAKELSFESLEIEPVDVFDRVHRIPFTVYAPQDFYSGNYAQAVFLITGDYSDALNDNADFAVYVNGQLASSVPLRVNGQQALDSFPVEFPLHHIKPGRNEIYLEVQTSMNDDADCFYESDHRELRMTIDPSSTLSLPTVAQMFQGHSLASLFDEFPADDQTTLGVKLPEAANAELIEAAAGVLARVSRVSLSDKFKLAITNDTFDAPVSQVVEFAYADKLTREEEDRFCLTLFKHNRRQQLSSDSLSLSDANESSFINKLVTPLKDFFEASKPRWSCARASVDGGARLIIAQDRYAQEVPVTLLVSANSTEMSKGILEITEDHRWSEIQEQALRLDKQGDMISYLRADRFNFSSAFSSFSNFRLALTNWVSGSSVLYVLLMLLSSVLFGMGSSKLFKAFSRNDI